MKQNKLSKINPSDFYERPWQCLINYKNKYTQHGDKNLVDSNRNDCMLKMKLHLK